MKTCPSCGRQTEEPIDKVKKNVFVFTVMTIFLSGIVLFNSEWTVVWWQARSHIVTVFVAMPAIAAYWWYRLLAERRKG